MSKPCRTHLQPCPPVPVAWVLSFAAHACLGLACSLLPGETPTHTARAAIEAPTLAVALVSPPPAPVVGELRIEGPEPTEAEAPEPRITVAPPDLPEPPPADTIEPPPPPDVTDSLAWREPPRALPPEPMAPSPTPVRELVEPPPCPESPPVPLVAAPAPAIRAVEPPPAELPPLAVERPATAREIVAVASSAPEPAPTPVSTTAEARVTVPVPSSRNVPPAYPLVARRRGLEGVVVLAVRVSPSGACLAVEVEKGSGHTVLDEAAVEAVRRWRFAPAQAGGEAVAAEVQVPIRFQLDD